jgi:hypothetical protein
MERERGRERAREKGCGLKRNCKGIEGDGQNC